MKKILITGGGSMIASYLAQEFGVGVELLSRAELDIGDMASFEEIIRSGAYGVVINTAGAAGREAGELFDINAVYPAEMAVVCGRHGVIFVYLSSSRVFDGRSERPYLEGDVPLPVDDYGLSKYTAERLIERELAGKGYYIIRLPMVLGMRKKRQETQIVNKLINAASKKERLKVSMDVYHSPVYCKDAARGIREVIEKEKPFGLYHITSGGYLSLFEIMTSILSKIGIDAEILPVKSADFGEGSLPAAQFALSSGKTDARGNVNQAIERFAEEYKNAGK